MSIEEKDRALFDQIAVKYIRKDLASSSSLPRKRRILKALHPLIAKSPRLGTIVDIGCGGGVAAGYLDSHYDRYIGIDQSNEMIEFGRKLFNKNPRVEFIAANIKADNLPPDVADVILSVGALHHMTEIDEVMQSLARMAKPGAFMVALEPQNQNPAVRLMRWIRGIVDSTYSEDQTFFSPQQLHDIFAKNGLSDISISYYGYFTPPFAEIIFSPQMLAVPLSRLAAACDDWLEDHLFNPLNKLSFGLIASGRFKK
jgi:ubiquinone/menaquinone biosynthesis C-methylase UbiE